MTIFASAETQGFYTPDAHGLQHLPPDAVEITDGLHAELLAAPRIDWTGPLPVAAEPLAPTAEALANLRRAEVRALLAAAGMTSQRCDLAGVPFPPNWVAYVADLRAVLADPTLTAPSRPSYPAGT